METIAVMVQMALDQLCQKMRPEEVTEKVTQGKLMERV